MSKTKILIVEDEAIIARDLQSSLQQMGYDVPFIASNGKEAITKAADLIPDLVLMDIILPGELDGIETARAIIAKDAIPIIYLTAYASDAILERAKETEPYGYLVKPTGDRELRSTIEMALHKHESDQRYKILCSSNLDGILITDVDTQMFKYANPIMCTWLGYSTEEIRNLGMAALHPAESMDYVMSEFEAHIQGRNKTSANLPFLKKDGTVIYMDATGSTTVIDGSRCSIGFFRDVTKRKEAEELLIKRERQLTESQRVARLGSWEWDITQNMIRWSDELYHLFSLKPQEFEATYEAFIRYVHPDDRNMLENKVRESIRLRKPYYTDARMLRPDGSSWIMEARGTVTYDSTGNPMLMHGTAQDITERKKKEEALIYSENKFHSLFNQAADSIFLLSLSGSDLIIEDANLAACVTHGYRKSELLGKSISLLDDPQTKTQIPHNLDILISGKSLNTEATHIRKDGSSFPVEISARLIYLNNGPHVLAIDRDITERKQAEKNLQESEAKYRKLIESANDAIFLADAETGIIIDANKKAEELLETPLNEIKGMHQSDLHPQDDIDMYKKIFRDHVLNGKSITRDVYIVNKTGDKIPVDISASIVEIRNKKIIQGIFRDITESKFIQNKISNQVRFLQTLLDTIPSPVFYKNNQGQYTGCNTAFEQFIGLPEDEIIGKTVYDMGPAEIAEMYNKKDRELIESPGKQSYEWKVKNKNGEVKDVIFNKATIVNHKGNIKGLIGVISDITERKKTEIELKERVQLAELSADIGIALTREATLTDMLHRCTTSLVKHIDSVLARIWLYNSEENTLELRSNAGLDVRNEKEITDYYGKHRIGMIARECTPFLINNINGDPHLTDKDWLKQKGIVSFAGHPLLIEDRLLGVMGLFCKKPLTDLTIKSLSLVSDMISLGIEKKRIEEQLQTRAVTDELTGLFNRRGFFTLAEQQCKLAARSKRSLALFYIDLDGLKNINDKHGHQEGDQAIYDIASILKKTFRQSDIIARLGGDEFVVLLTDPSENVINTIIMNHFQRNLKKHNDEGGRMYTLKVSIGLSYYDPQRPCSIFELVNEADVQMYKHKTLKKTGNKPLL